jgi:hypothetical protein
LNFLFITKRSFPTGKSCLFNIIEFEIGDEL